MSIFKIKDKKLFLFKIQELITFFRKIPQGVLALFTVHKNIVMNVLAHHGLLWQFPQFDNTPVDLSPESKMLKANWKHAWEVEGLRT